MAYSEYAMECPYCGNTVNQRDGYCNGCWRKVYENKISGLVHGNFSNANTISGEVKFHASRGHGFAAERANHLADVFSGKNAYIVGDDNAKNGADRLVDGISIQSKYCQSGSKCIHECFKDGKFRYLNKDGTPMQIEVPSDKYEDAVRAMEERIRRGQIPGVRDIKEARNIVRKGHFTYEQAKNIAKSGTIESLTYDMVNGSIIASYTFGITTAMTYAVSIWNGKSSSEALKNAISAGFSAGGITFAAAVLSGQMTKMGAHHLLSGISSNIVDMIGPKASSVLANSLNHGKSIYGAAAMKSAQRLIESNMITATATLVASSGGDVADVFNGRMSGRQLMKNTVNRGVALAGGQIGWQAGAAAGAGIGSIIPGVGTAIGSMAGALIGALCGGKIAGSVSSSITDAYIDDDTKLMIDVIDKKMQKLSGDYLLSHNEAEKVISGLVSKGKLCSTELKYMYASYNGYEKYAERLLIPEIEQVVRRRRRVELPDNGKMVLGIKQELEKWG